MMNVRDDKHQNRHGNDRKHHTLPLFADVAELPGVGRDAPLNPPLNPPLDAGKKIDRVILNRELQRARVQRRNVQRRRKPVNPHLAAARKLSKDIRRLADGSQEQTLTGRAICQHLRALLQETESREAEICKPSSHKT